MKQTVSRFSFCLRVGSAVLWIFLISLGFSQQEQKDFTVEEIYGSDKFAGDSLRSIQWLPDSKQFSYMERDSMTGVDNIWVYEVATGRRTLLVDASKLVLRERDQPFPISHYLWSPDGDKILFADKLRARAVKTGGNFLLYDIRTQKFQKLTDTNEPQVNVQFSPDGKMIGFVRSNNIYVMDLTSGTETQLTFDGAEHVLNGHFDWVYEEEFKIIVGWKWSPDSKRIAYWQLDENRVPEFPIMNFEPLHPQVTTMRYPKAGDPNSIVRIGIVSLETKQTTWADIGSEDDIYIPRIKWTRNPNVLSIQRMNRAQNKLELLLADATTGKTRVILTEEEDTWVDVRDHLTFLEQDQFLWSSERDGFLHFYLYAMDGSLIRQVTRGPWEVDKLCAVDENHRAIYFTSTEQSPLERHVNRITLEGTHMQRLSEEEGWHKAKFSPDVSKYIHTYSSSSIPPRVSLRNNDGRLVRSIEDNPMHILNEYRMSKMEFFAFTTSDGIILNGWMIKPPGFSSNGGEPTKKYPALLYVYAGPGSQTVKNSWDGNRYLWHQLMAQKGYIVVSVDNRGTGARGKAFKSITYKNLGKWESNDQIEAAKFLGSLPYVDPSRIGIWGTSYGGYLASLATFVGSDVFKTAVAVAPVTDWRFYDTIYTERYMLRPEKNPEGYAESAPLMHAEKLHGSYLLIHGTADDNVHWQNSVMLADQLRKHGKQFETMFYHGEDHRLRGPNTRVHLFTLITNFILEYL
ncbi:MAG: DPP IV N-terminal domain-containing protein [Bacteroidota bacterium]